MGFIALTHTPVQQQHKQINNNLQHYTTRTTRTKTDDMARHQILLALLSPTFSRVDQIEIIKTKSTIHFIFFSSFRK